MSASRSPLVIFQHIRRTGGTSMWKILRTYYGNDRVHRVMTADIPKNDEIITDLLKTSAYKFDVIGGHMSHFGLHVHSPRPTTHITMIRKPADMVLSHYYKILRKDSLPLHEKFNSEINSIEEAIPYLDEFFNCQTRIIGGIPYGEPITDQTLKDAKANLENHFSTVGVLDRYQETLQVLSSRNGWGRYIPPAHKNSGENRPDEISQSIYDMINARCQYDIELYHFANDLLTRYVQEDRWRIRFDMAKYRVGQMLNPASE